MRVLVGERMCMPSKDVRAKVTVNEANGYLDTFSTMIVNIDC